jgi:hypothetical protein
MEIYGSESEHFYRIWIRPKLTDYFGCGDEFGSTTLVICNFYGTRYPISFLSIKQKFFLQMFHTFSFLGILIHKATLNPNPHSARLSESESSPDPQLCLLEKFPSFFVGSGMKNVRIRDGKIFGSGI